MGSIAEIMSRVERVNKSMAEYKDKSLDLNFTLLARRLSALRKEYENLGRGSLWEIKITRGTIFLTGVNEMDAQQLTYERFGEKAQSIKLIPTSRILKL